MAQKKSSQNKKKKANKSLVFKDLLSLKFAKNPKFILSTGIFIIAFSILLFVSFISFFYTGAKDQSLRDHGWISLLQTDIAVHNWIGKTGAYFSNLLIPNGFGIASLSIVLIVFLIGSNILKFKILPFNKTLKYSFIITVWLSVSLGYVFTLINNDKLIFLGGDYGFFMSKFLISLIGKFGTAIILLLSAFVFIIYTFENVYLSFKQWIFTLIKKEKQIVKKTKTQKSCDKDNKEKIIAEDTPLSIEIADNEVNEIQLDDKSSDTVESEIIFENEDLDLNNQNPIADIIEEENNDIDFEVTSVQNQKEDINENQFSQSQNDHEDLKEELTDYDPTLDLSHFSYPELSLLEDHKIDNQEVSKEEIVANKNRIVETLRNYKIEIEKIKATVGPTITLYEIIPAPGIRISKIKNLEDDIALSLSALGIRIIAPMPGRGTIGIEVPNINPEVVSMRSVIASAKFQESRYALPVAIGKTISNDTYIFDLAKMPHLLVAGATGQGKSVGLNAILTSLLYKKHPAELKFVLVDPKKVELSIYSNIEKHYLAKLPDAEEAIITDTQKVVYTLNSLTIEMDLRYDLLKNAACKNIKEYNKKFTRRKLNPENGHKFLPYIVLVIDEFADLIMTAGKEIEAPIARIAQLARAVGIHLIIATQRPSTNIITGVIKANFPARIAFKVASMIDSKTILDGSGANQLIGRGDMLITSGSDLIRVQCAFVDTPEVEAIVEHISGQQSFPSAFLLPEYTGDEQEKLDIDLSKRDALFDEAARLIVLHQQGSTSLIQRKFSIGYNRAGRIIDQLEAAGIVGPFEGSKARQVLYSDEYSLEQYLNSL